MSDFFENDQQKAEQPITDGTVGEEVTAETDTDNEESTVFSTPAEHNDGSAKKTGKKRLVSIIAAALAVAVLVGGTIAVVKLIPELKEDETPSSVFEDISVIDKDSSNFTAIDVTNTNGSFKFSTKQIEAVNDSGETEVTTYWTVDGIDISKLSSDSVKAIVAAAANVTAVREITTKSAEECGFNEPLITVSVEDATNGSFAFKVGAQSPDGLGYYFMLDGSDKIYVVSTNELSDLQFELLDLSDKTAIPATTFSVDTDENKEADGSYAYFDSLTLSGKLFPETVTINNNDEDSASAGILPYIITTPTKRFANSEKLSPLVGLYSNEVSVSGNYAFDITEQSVKDAGLDDPDAVVTMTIKGESKTFVISVVDDNYCAVVYDGATMIRKVSTEQFEFLSYKTEDFYNKNPFMYSISDLSSMEFTEEDANIKFDISSTQGEESNNTYKISANGTEISADGFQSFYADFVGTQLTDFTVDEVSGKPISTITFNFNSGKKATVSFYKVNETKYQCSIDGMPMGRITSAAYKKIVRSIKTQANIEAAE